jgi:F420-non-reducing hydrogenase iron-sulfur subunit
MADFEPRIIAFLCNWCTYTGADLAGTSRLQYPPNIRVIRLMCSGALDPVYVAKALLEGADGVLIGGCHPGDCHYQSGNYKARRRVAILNEILDQMGLDKERVWLRWISASEGQYFADTVTEMVASIKEMGPNPARELWAT